MSDSLRIGRVIELLGGGVASTLPQCAGAIFRLGRAYDLGSPQPVVDFSVTLMGDGTRPVGWRVDNRTFSLVITIIVPSTGSSAAAQQADRLTMVAAREVLLQVIAADQFDLIWAPDGTNGARNTVFECWRAKAATISWDMIRDRQRISELEVSFEAMPYGRSDTLETLSFDNPVAGASTPVTPVLLDDFSSVSSVQQNTWWAQSVVTASGNNSAYWSHALSDGESPMWYVHTIAGTDITGCDKLWFWLGLTTTAAGYRHWHLGTTWFEFKLTDNSGRVLTWGLSRTCQGGSKLGWPHWNLISAKIPQGQAFTYTNVVQYSIKVWTEYHFWNGNRELFDDAYLSEVTASPSASLHRPASERGGTYVLYKITGTAPTMLNVHGQLSSQELVASTRVITLGGSPGVVNSYTAPADNPSWLFGDSSNFDRGTAGTWTGSDGLATNATIAVSTTQFRSSPNALRVTPTVGGSDATIASCATANVDTQGVPLSPGEFVQCKAWARAGTTTRTVTVKAEFFNASKVSLGAAVTAATAADTNTGFTQYTGRAVAPASTAFARMLITVTTPAGGEFHYFDDLFFSYAVQATVVCVGSGGAGGSVSAASTSGGGGGGGEIAWEGPLALNAGTGHNYTIGKGGSGTLSGGSGPSGGTTQFAGATLNVVAHGGTGGVNELTNDSTNGAGGAGGTGSTNAHHFNGGAGAAGSLVAGSRFGGGGGGAASDGGAGNAGSGAASGAGGTAGTLNVMGGRGGSGSHSHGGDGYGGYAPGGGGGGAANQTLVRTGGKGGDGRIVLIMKTYTVVGTFPTFLVHMPSSHSPILSQPVIAVGNALDVPDGAAEYPAGSIEGQLARYRGTYTVYLVNWSWHAAGARTVSVTINQHMATGGTVASATVSASVDPVTVVNGMVNLGEVTLPILAMTSENIDAYFAVSVTSVDTADRFLDVLLLDTRGNTVLINLASTAYTDYWVDAPEISADVGNVLGSMTDRTQAISVLSDTILTGGPLRLVPGENLITVYSPSGQPALEGDYWPRWWHERLE